MQKKTATVASKPVVAKSAPKSAKKVAVAAVVPAKKMTRKKK